MERFQRYNKTKEKINKTEKKNPFQSDISCFKNKIILICMAVWFKA